jgi:hypothetical protein
MAVKYLVVNDNEDAFLAPFTERYRLFTDRGAAVKHARSIGYEGGYDLRVNVTPGVKNIYMCGGINVYLIALEEDL